MNIQHIILLFLVFLTGCEGAFEINNETDSGNHATLPTSPVPNSGTNTTRTPAEILNGEALYQKHCSGCHGATAEGAGPFPSSIQGFEPILPILSTGRGAMPSISILTEEADLIQAYLLTLAPPTNSLDGAGLYGRYCSSCHGADASGGANWEGSIQAYEPIAGIVANGRGAMDPIPIDDVQTAKVQAFLLTLGEPLSTLSGPEVYDRLCVGCHGARGAGSDTKGMQLRFHDDAFSTYWIRQGRSTNTYDSPMPAYPADMISDTQVAEMLEWLDATPKASDGEGLFLQFCGNCHGHDAKGGASGENIRGGDSFTGVVRSGKNRSDGFGRRRSYMTAWDSMQLSDSDVQAISSYVGSL